MLIYIIKLYFMEKIKVRYYGEIWESKIFMNKTIYKNVVANFNNCKITITRNGATLNVYLRLVEFLN